MNEGKYVYPIIHQYSIDLNKFFKQQKKLIVVINEFIRKIKAVKRIQKPSGKFQKRDYSRELM